MSFKPLMRISKIALAAGTAAALAALAPGLAPYEAAAAVFRSAGGPAPLRRSASSPMSSGGLRSGAGVRAALVSDLFSSPVALSLASPTMAQVHAAVVRDAAAVPTRNAVLDPVQVLPMLPLSVAMSAAAPPGAGHALAISASHRGADVSAAAAPGPALAAGGNGSPRGQLASARRLGASAFTGERSRGESVIATPPAGGPEPAGSVLGARSDVRAAAEAERSLAPVEAASLQPAREIGRSFVPDHTVLPGGVNWIDRAAVKIMFLQRSISIASGVLAMVAFPVVAKRALGPEDFCVMMALGPLASIATGPINGLIANKVERRKGLILLAAARGVLMMALPLLSWFGAMSFRTLLLFQIAVGWQGSSLMTNENAIFAGMAGRNRVDTIYNLQSVNYIFLQVLLNLILGAGAFVFGVNPMAPFWVAALVNLLIVIPILYYKLPGRPAPRPAAQAAGDGRTLPRAVGTFSRRYWKEIVLFGAALGAYLAWGSPLWMSAALLWGVSRTDGFKAVWRSKNLRAAITLTALAFGFIEPFLSSVVPCAAGFLGGSDVRTAAIFSQMTGMFYFGQLTANSSRVNLPDLRIGTARVPSRRLLEAAVVAMGAVWSYLHLLPGNAAAAGAAALACAGLILVAARMSDGGWIRYFVIGLLAALLLPFFFFQALPAHLAGMFVLGLFVGPLGAILNAYLGKNAPKDRPGDAFGANASLKYAAVSFGGGFAAILLGLYGHAFPAVLLPVALIGGVIGLLFAVLRSRLPDLDERAGSAGRDAAR